MNWQLARPAWGMAGYTDDTTPGQAAGEVSPAVDAALLDGISAGDQSAFATLVDRHYGMVFRLSARVLGNAADAEDVVLDLLKNAENANKNIMYTAETTGFSFLSFT